MDESKDEAKYRRSSALESYGHHDRPVYDGAHDVFGDEEHHQVGILPPVDPIPLQIADSCRRYITRRCRGNS